jgi:nonsense-mediated mRNA decay protein 3
LVQRFCPKCGSKDKPFFKGFCVDCYLTDNDLVRIPKRMSVDACPSCLRFRIHGEWLPSTRENTSRFIEEQVKLRQIENSSAEARLVKPLKDGAVFELVLRGELGGEKVELRKNVELLYAAKQCLICARKQSKYYKALLQLRPKDAGASPSKIQSAFHFVRNHNRELSVTDREAEIFKFKEDKNGLNIYLGSLKAAQSIVSMLRSKFNAEVRQSRTLVGVDKNGHNDYKSTFSVRL